MKEKQPANYRMMHSLLLSSGIPWKRNFFTISSTIFYHHDTSTTQASDDDFHLMAEGFLFCCDVFSFTAMFFPNHDISMFSFVNNVYEMLVHIHYYYIISIRVCFVKNCMVIKGYLVRRNNTQRPIQAHKESFETIHE